MQSTVVLTDNQLMQKIRRRLSDILTRLKQFFALVLDVNNWNPGFLSRYIADSYTVRNDGLTPASFVGYPLAIGVIFSMFVVKTYVKLVTFVSDSLVYLTRRYGPVEVLDKVFGRRLPFIKMTGDNLLDFVMKQLYLPIFARLEEMILRFTDSDKVMILRDTFRLGQYSRLTSFMMKIPVVNFFYAPFVTTIEQLSDPGAFACAE